MIVHLVEFRIMPGFEAEVVATLHHTPLVGPRPDGLLAHSVGRRLGHSHREHLLATAWQDFESWRRALDSSDSPPCLARVAGKLSAREDTVIDVVASAGPSWEEGRVLRIYRARVRAEVMAEWEKRAFGAVKSMSGGPGLVSMLVGPSWPRPEADGDRVVFAFSAWREWSDVLAATGGRIHQPLRLTDLADLERPIDAEHYEIIPPPLV